MKFGFPYHDNVCVPQGPIPSRVKCISFLERSINPFVSVQYKGLELVEDYLRDLYVFMSI
jgi:hypothetical protein